MQTPSGITDPLDQHPLDEAVYVFVVAIDESRVGLPALPDVAERFLDLIDVGLGKDAGPAECPRPREAAGHVLVEQAPIEAKRLLELERRGVGRGVKTSRPERAHEATIASRASSARP